MRSDSQISKDFDGWIEIHPAQPPPHLLCFEDIVEQDCKINLNTRYIAAEKSNPKFSISTIIIENGLIKFQFKKMRHIIAAFNLKFMKLS